MRIRAAAIRSDWTSRIILARSFIVAIPKPDASSTRPAASVFSLLRMATAFTSEPACSAASNAMASGGRQAPAGFMTGGAGGCVASAAVAPNMSICIWISNTMEKGGEPDAASSS
jgi:hypothetical protein